MFRFARQCDVNIGRTGLPECPGQILCSRSRRIDAGGFYFREQNRGGALRQLEFRAGRLPARCIRQKSLVEELTRARSGLDGFRRRHGCLLE